MVVKYSVKKGDSGSVIVIAESLVRSELLEPEVVHEAIKKAEEKGYRNIAVSNSSIHAFYEDGEPATEPRPNKKIIYKRHIQCSSTQFP